MAYRNKTYVCFDADNDIKYYYLMLAWKENGSTSFNFQNAHEINNINDGSSEIQIKNKLRERLKDTKVMIVLIGSSTKNLYKFVRWEIEFALENNIPIIAVNLNKNKHQDNLCPPILKDELAIYIPYSQTVIDYALNYWIQKHNELKLLGEKGAYKYPEEFYKRLDI